MAWQLALLAIAILYIVNFYRNVKRYPPGPFPLPFIGNLFLFPEDDVHLFLHQLSLKYGPVFTLFTPRATVIITDYKHIKEALVVKGEHFLGRNHDDLLHRVENGGVIMSEGANWREQRRLSLQILRTFGMGKNVMEQQIGRCIEEMLLQIEAIEDKKHVDMFLPIQMGVANVINETLFGYHYTRENISKLQYFVQIVNNHFDFLSKYRCVRLLQAIPWLRYVPVLNYYGRGIVQRNSRQLSAYIEAEVLAQKQDYDTSTTPTTFTQAYLQEIEKSRSAPHSYYSIDQLVCVATDFWLAGMETTSTTLRWAINLLVAFPDVQTKMQAEIDRVIGRNRLPQMADRNEMPYCSAALIELQRRANIVPFLAVHRTTADVSIFGYEIPNDTYTLVTIGAILQYDSIFSDPDRFDPQRFLEDDGKTMKKDLIERMVAFGLGKRACAGEGLARMELFLFLTTLLQRFRFEIPSGRPPPDLRPIFSSVLMPRPYEVTVVPRI